MATSPPSVVDLPLQGIVQLLVSKLIQSLQSYTETLGPYRQYVPLVGVALVAILAVNLFSLTGVPASERPTQYNVSAPKEADPAWQGKLVDEPVLKVGGHLKFDGRGLIAVLRFTTLI